MEESIQTKTQVQAVLFRIVGIIYIWVIVIVMERLWLYHYMTLVLHI